MLKFILGLALAGSVAGAGMAVFQDQLLYFPENVRMSEVMVPPFRA